MEGGYGEVPDLVKRFVVYFYRHIRCEAHTCFQSKTLAGLGHLETLFVPAKGEEYPGDPVYV